MRFIKFTKFIFALISVVIIVSCGKDDGKDVISDFSIAGYVQKGQFIKGADVTAYSLNSELRATGESFSGAIKDDLGSFGILTKTEAPYFELKAEGYYFNENMGQMSDAPISLSALVSSSQRNVNINLLTTITSARIKRLVSEGKSFDLAKRQAEKEAANLFSIPLEYVEVGFDAMNIAEDGNANAVLLAVSCLIQEGRNAGIIQKVIADVSSEFAANGTLSANLMEAIFDERKNISVTNIVRHIVNFYNEKGITNFKIPPFYAMLNDEYANGCHIIEMYNDLTDDNYWVQVEGGTKTYYMISYEDFVVESDVDWITAEATEISSNFYVFRINISSNSAIQGRIGRWIVKTKNGDLLYSDTINQMGNGQRIYLNLNGNVPRTNGLNEGDKVNINGKDYALLFDSYQNQYYVDLPKSDNGYGISTTPDMVVAGKNGDVLCATFTYDSEIDEFIDGGNGKTDVVGTVEVVSYNGMQAGGKTPYYAAFKGLPGNELPNPLYAKLEIACSLLTCQFYYANSLKPFGFEKLEVEFDTDGFLSGEVTVCMYPEHNLYDHSYIVPQTEYKNKSNKVIVHNVNKDNKVSFLVHPQMVSFIKCTVYGDSGSRLFQGELNVNSELKKGVMQNYTIYIPE